MNTRTITLMVLACGFALAGTAEAQMCKWTDENGTVHYDTECPDDVESRDVDVSDALSTTGPDPYADSRKAAADRSTSSKNQKSAGSSRGSGLSCEQAREKRLKPERDRLISQCKAQGDKDAAQCERFYADYGNGGRQGGRTVPPKYMNIPECQDG